MDGSRKEALSNEGKDLAAGAEKPALQEIFPIVEEVHFDPEDHRERDVKSAEPNGPDRKTTLGRIKNWGMWGGRAAATHVGKHFLEGAFETSVYGGSVWGFTKLMQLLVHLSWISGPAAPLLAWGLSFIVSAAIFTAFNIATIKAYDAAKMDLLGYERLKKIRGKGPLGKIADFAIFAGLSVWDPIDATIYARKGSEKYDGFSTRDRINFAFSTILANAFWVSGFSFGLGWLGFL